MWRDLIIILLGLWLLVFAFLDFESDAVDVSLTVYTGLLVLALGIWNIVSARRTRAQAERTDAEKARADFKAPPEPRYMELQAERDAHQDFRGLSKEEDPTRIST